MFCYKPVPALSTREPFPGFLFSDGHLLSNGGAGECHRRGREEKTKKKDNSMRGGDEDEQGEKPQLNSVRVIRDVRATHSAGTKDDVCDSSS